jgi:hypothetical protein
MYQIKTHRFFVASLILITACMFTISVAAQQGMPKLSMKELKDMPLKKLINPNDAGEVTSCNIGFDNEFKDIVEIKIIDGKEPERLRDQLAKLKIGQLIYIDARIAIIEGKRTKLPSIVYELVP